MGYNPITVYKKTRFQLIPLFIGFKIITVHLSI